MATVNFLYRSVKDYANLEIRLLFTQDEKNNVLGAKSKIFVSKEHWSKHKKRSKNITVINEQNRVNSEMKNLELYIIKAFEKDNPKFVNKEWLVSIVDNYYNPQQIDNNIPYDLINYIEYYKEFRNNEISKEAIKKYNVVKNKLKRFEKETKKIIKIKEVNNTLKNELIQYYGKNNYSQNTIQREFVFIKSFCNHARKRGLEVSTELEDFKVDRAKVKHIYLNEEELKQIYNLSKLELTDSLLNARDWLVISCYTGQRVSDFLTFNKNMIRIENDKPLLEFTQKKTKKIMTIPIHPIVNKILESRNGDFPYKISDQKYNDYIKKICEIANINETIKGVKKVMISKGVYRNIEGRYKKFELVTSHIGRRSFATNFFGKIPTALIISATGHKTEEIFNDYLQKSSTDRALELAKYF
jgi:site-specific recombinase XerD